MFGGGVVCPAFREGYGGEGGGGGRGWEAIAAVECAGPLGRGQNERDLEGGEARRP